MLDLFYNCHELRYVGQIKNKRGQSVMLPQYTFLHYPDGKSMLDQYHIITQAFRIIKDEEQRIFASRLK